MSGRGDEYLANLEARWNALKVGRQIAVLALIVLGLTAIFQAAIEGKF